MCKGSCNISAMKGKFFKFLLISVLGLAISACHKPSNAMGGGDAIDRIPAEDCASNTYLQKYDCSVSRIRQAANRGDPDAQYALAYIYYYGIGAAQDKQAARLWMNRAAAQGQPLAKTADDLLTTEPYTMDSGSYGNFHSTGSSNPGEIESVRLDRDKEKYQYAHSNYYKRHSSNQSVHSSRNSKNSSTTLNTDSSYSDADSYNVLQKRARYSPDNNAQKRTRYSDQEAYRTIQAQQSKGHPVRGIDRKSNSKRNSKKKSNNNTSPSTQSSKFYSKPEKKPRPADLPPYDALPSLDKLNSRVPDKSIEEVLPNYGKQRDGDKSVIKSLQRTEPSPSKKSIHPEPLTQNEKDRTLPSPLVQVSAQNKSFVADHEELSLAQEEKEALDTSQTHYTLQLMGGTNLKLIKQFIDSHHLGKKVRYYSAKLNHETWYMVIYGDYPNMETAQAAMEGMPNYLRALHPWVKSYRIVHDEIRFHEMIS